MLSLKDKNLVTMQQQPEIKTVTEHSHFGQILKDYYEKGQLFIKLPANNLPLEFVKRVEDYNVLFSVPNVKNLPHECLIVAKLDNELVYGTMTQLRQRREIFTFVPTKFQIIKFHRKDQRIGLKDDGGKRIIFITNIVSHFNLETDIITEKKKVDQIRNRITLELEKIFDRIRIFFIGEKQTDNRFRYFSSNTSTIYIPNIKTPGESSAEEHYSNYMESIYASDYQLKSSGLISELTTPFLYKNQLPYGYIQINSAQTITSSVTLRIKMYALHIEQLFEKSGIFKPTTERFIVIDVSQGGFAIAFKDKIFLKYFQQNVSMCIKMLLADKDIEMYVVVRHITPDSRMITVGFQILAMMEEGSAYEDFLKSLSSGDTNKNV